MPHKQISKTLASEILGRIFGLILSIALARSLEIDEFGRWSYLQAILLYLIVLIEFGSNQEGIRLIIKHKDAPSELDKVFSSIIKNRSIGTILSIASITILLPINAINPTEFLTLIVCILSYSISKDWFLRATNRQFEASLQNTTHLALLIAIILAFNIIEKKSLLSAASLTLGKGILLGGITILISAMYVPRKKALSNFSLKNLTVPEKGLIYLVSGSLLAKAYFNSDIIIIATMLDSQQVGIYSAIATIYAAFVAFRGVIITTLYPTLCSTPRGDILVKKAIKLSLAFGFASLPLFIIAFIYKADFIELFLGSRYLSKTTTELADIFIATCIVLSFGLLYPNMLHVRGMSKSFFYLTLTASMVNIGGNLLLINQHGIKAAALTTLAAESIIITFSFILLFKKQAA
ncbi:oligosaccharide flippase family protein [Pseudomonas sp. GCM10022188]|uniref:oligosaccharide flippase family protein n=1 Tax=Pseudomonas TaxID=286 RepID=UPI001E288100|nr:oligosaccharide flippase family protein [Pseudomonas oryzagri]MCC6076900.1 oligosaccharide flippase family protein [Pseudomonas oryzagri]